MPGFFRHEASNRRVMRIEPLRCKTKASFGLRDQERSVDGRGKGAPRRSIAKGRAPLGKHEAQPHDPRTLIQSDRTQSVQEAFLRPGDGERKVYLPSKEASPELVGVVCQDDEILDGRSTFKVAFVRLELQSIRRERLHAIRARSDGSPIEGISLERLTVKDMSGKNAELEYVHEVVGWLTRGQLDGEIVDSLCRFDRGKVSCIRAFVLRSRDLIESVDDIVGGGEGAI